MENNGYSTFIEADDSIAILVNNHFVRISKPVLTDLSIDLGGLNNWDNYPKSLSDLFWGSRTTQLGLYNSYGSFPVTLQGKVRGEIKEFTNTLNFTDSSAHRFVPRLWASAKIDNLLQLIEVYGESDELVNQIIELSLRFQILTIYTAFYVDPTDIEKTEELLPTEFIVEQNYPNPFNPSTKIKYSIPVGQSNYHVVIKVYDVLGRLVEELMNTNQQPGNYEVEFNANGLTSGIYFYTVTAGKFSLTKKMVLMR